MFIAAEEGSQVRVGAAGCEGRKMEKAWEELAAFVVKFRAFFHTFSAPSDISFSTESSAGIPPSNLYFKCSNSSSGCGG